MVMIIHMILYHVNWNLIWIQLIDGSSIDYNINERLSSNRFEWISWIESSLVGLVGLDYRILHMYINGISMVIGQLNG